MFREIYSEPSCHVVVPCVTMNQCSGLRSREMYLPTPPATNTQFWSRRLYRILFATPLPARASTSQTAEFPLGAPHQEVFPLLRYTRRLLCFCWCLFAITTGTKPMSLEREFGGEVNFAELEAALEEFSEDSR